MLVLCFFPPIQWLESVFLKYLKDWEDSVIQQHKSKIMLSRETLEGIRITGMNACSYFIATLFWINFHPTLKDHFEFFIFCSQLVY